jgi:hypothetical protein
MGSSASTPWVREPWCARAGRCSPALTPGSGRPSAPLSVAPIATGTSYRWSTGPGPSPSSGPATSVARKLPRTPPCLTTAMGSSGPAQEPTWASPDTWTGRNSAARNSRATHPRIHGAERRQAGAGARTDFRVWGGSSCPSKRAPTSRGSRAQRKQGRPRTETRMKPPCGVTAAFWSRAP